MVAGKPYWRRRIRWASDATRTQPLWWPILSWIATLLIAFVVRGVPDSLFQIPDSVQDLDSSDIMRFVVTFPAALVVLWLVNWVRAPGNLDQESQIELRFLREQVYAFEERMRPRLWITGKIYKDSPIADLYSDGGGINVGFKLENRSDSELHDVRVELIKMELAFPDTYSEEDRYITYEDMGCVTAFPIVLEWSPVEQISEGVSCTTIPAGASRLVGLFSESFILSASHEVRPSLGVSSSFVYRVAVQISAKGIPAISSRDYIVSRFNRSGEVMRVRDIPYVIEPKDAYELMSLRSD